MPKGPSKTKRLNLQECLDPWSFVHWWWSAGEALDRNHDGCYHHGNHHCGNCLCHCLCQGNVDVCPLGMHLGEGDHYLALCLDLMGVCPLSHPPCRVKNEMWMVTSLYNLGHKYLHAHSYMYIHTQTWVGKTFLYFDLFQLWMSIVDMKSKPSTSLETKLDFIPTCFKWLFSFLLYEISHFHFP